MIIEFLNKLYSESLEEKIQLESKYQQIKIKFDKNDKYIQKLKKSEEETTDVFSPRKQNRNIRNNIVALENEQETLLTELEKYKEKLLWINKRLEEFEEAIKDIKKLEIQKNRISPPDQKTQNQIDQSNIDLYNIINPIIHKIELCTKFVEVDTVRCKIELNSLKHKLNEILVYSSSDD